MDTIKSYQNWYDQHYQDLFKYGLWLRGGEINTLPRSEYEARPFRALFVRLSTYFDTGYSFTHQILYQIAAGVPGVFPDLAYLPPKQDVPLLARAQVPWLLGTQTKFGPAAFDLIGFSNSIVQELLNLPTFLSKSGVPLKKSERLTRQDLPLLILGGANALYSTVIWGDDPMVDGVFVGESDQCLRRMLEICRDGKAQGRSKAEILSELEQIPGFLQPENPRSTRKNFVPNLNQSEALERGPVYYLEDQLGSSHLQISEGCPCFCSFCAESWDRKPYRERSAAVLEETALRVKAAMGLDRIDIYSFNFNMHSGLYKILWDLVPHFRTIGLKSQRFDLLAHDPMMVEFQHAIEKASLTCGLEGISPRLRKYLHKNLENEQLHRSLSAIFKSRTRELKMFLIATGLEEDQDFTALDDLLDHLKQVRQASHSSTRIIFSMTPLVRFPWTPLEFEDGYPIEHYEAIIKRTAGRVRSAGFEFRESADLPEYWVSQVLVRADRDEISAALLSALGRTGYVYYRDIPESFMHEFREALKARGLDPDSLIKGFSLEESLKKPWSKIETGVRRDFLWEEVKRARSYVEIDYCLGRSWTKAKCFHCGGCPTRFHVRDIVLSQQKRAYSLEQFKGRIKSARDATAAVSFSMEAGPRTRGVPRKMLGVALARALMMTDPALARLYRGFQGSFWDDESREVWVEGQDIVALGFSKDSASGLGAMISNPVFLAAVNEKLEEWGDLKGLATPAMHPRLLAISSRFPLKADRYCKSRGLKYTLRKAPDGAYSYEFMKESVKKGYLTALTERRDKGLSSCELVFGSKFNAREFAQEAYSFSRPSDWVTLSMTARQ